jgi:hypothetical protein
MLKYSSLQLIYWVNQMEEEPMVRIVKRALKDEYTEKIVAKLRDDHKLSKDDIHTDNKGEVVIQTANDLAQTVTDLIYQLADEKAESWWKKHIHKDNEKEGKNTSQSTR